MTRTGRRRVTFSFLWRGTAKGSSGEPWFDTISSLIRCSCIGPHFLAQWFVDLVPRREIIQGHRRTELWGAWGGWIGSRSSLNPKALNHVGSSWPVLLAFCLNPHRSWEGAVAVTSPSQCFLLMRQLFLFCRCVASEPAPNPSGNSVLSSQPCSYIYMGGGGEYHIYIYTYTHTYIIHTHTYIYIYISYTHTYIHIYIYTHTHICIYIYIYMYIDIQTHIYRYIYINV